MVQTRSQSKGVKAPMVKWSPNSTNRKEQEIKPLIIDDIQTAPHSSKIDNQQNSTDVKMHTKYPQSQNYSQLVIRPPPRPPDPLQPTPKVNAEMGPNLDFEENSPHEEGIITEMYESPNKSYLEQPQELADQGSAFMSSLMNYPFKALGIKIKTVGPDNHKSLQAEHGIKSLSNILTKHLTGQAQTWHKFLSLATFAYNTFHSPNLGNYSPFELTHGREPRILLDLETDPYTKVSGTYKDYHTLLTKRLKHLQNMLQNFKSKCIALINKDR